MRTFIFCIIALTSFGHVTCGGNCADSMTTDPAFLKCAADSAEFFMSMSTATPEEIMKLMCSPSGKAFMTCIMPLMETCPELKQTLNLGDMLGGQVNESVFTPAEMIDVTCELQKEGCSEMQGCFNLGAPNRRKRGVSMPANIFERFHSETVAVCAEGSPVKAMLMCMDDKLKYCDPFHVPKIERFIQQMIISLDLGSVPGMSHFDHLRRSIAFVKGNCGKLPTDFSTTNCVMMTTELDACTTNITDMYVNMDKCGVRPMAEHCVSDYIKPKCGKDIATFYTNHIGYIFNKIPAECDTSAAPAVVVSSTVFVALLVSFLLN